MAALHDEDGFAPPSNDAYTGMLSISLLALVGACVLLYLDYSQYPEANPPKVNVPPPGTKLVESPLLKAKAESKDFHVRPDNITLFTGKDQTVSVKNGKAEGAPEVKPADAGVSAEVVDEGKSVKIVVGAEAKEMLYEITVRGEGDKTALLKVNVKEKKE